MRRKSTAAWLNGYAAGFNLHSVAPAAGIKFDLARHYYRTNAALLADVVAEQQIALGETLAAPLDAVRALPAPARLEALTAAVLAGLVRTIEGHLAARAALAALPGVAAGLRHADAWLVDLFAEALAAAGVTGPAVAVLARSAVMLVGEWGPLLAQPEGAAQGAAAQGAVAAALAGMLGAAAR